MLEKIDDGNLTFRWALEFVKELANNGLEHAILSPGSRSTPLTMAFSLHPQIQKHVVLDERSAGFIALGIGKSAGKPAALVCTSGTAAANYYPAVIEAKMSGTPLLVITADRPPHLRAVGASQSIDQIKMFGDYPVMFFDAGEPKSKKTDFERLRLLACQAYQDSITLKGPVHTNFAFRKPLEPTTGFYREQLSEVINAPATKPKSRVYQAVLNNVELPQEIQELITKARRPLVIAGPRRAFDDNTAINKFCGDLRAPLLAESPSQLTGNPFSISFFDAFLRNETIRKDLEPDLIIRFGHQPISKGIELYLKQYHSVPVIALTNDFLWHDATYSVDYLIRSESVPRFAEANWSSVNSLWTALWQDVQEKFRKKIITVLKKYPILTDGKVVSEITKDIPGDWNIFLSNSFPVRDFNLFSLGKGHHSRIFVNRGASGIDGITSTAIGTTLGSGTNTLLLTGDLAFLHDTNALLSAPLLEQQTLIILISNNRGGNIFRMLPVYKHQDIYKNYFETPQQADIKQLISAFNAGYKQITSIENLLPAFHEFGTHKGIHIIECTTDPDLSMSERKEIWGP